MSKEDFYGDFLKELGALDHWASRKPAQSGEPAPDGAEEAAPLDLPTESVVGATLPGAADVARQRSRPILLSRYDPDVRRLLEAVAFFSARTRRLAVQGLQRAVDRVNAGHFDFLLKPMPATTMVKATVESQASAGMTSLESGTDLRITTSTGAVGFFSTSRALQIWPLTVTTGQPRTRRGGGSRVILQVQVVGSGPSRTASPVRGVPGLAFHINYRQDYSRSRRIAGMLDGRVVVHVAFDRKASDDDGALPAGAQRCQASIGPPRTLDAPEMDEVEHPLSRIRSFFNLPEQDLFLDVALPASPESWKTATFYLDLEQNWPAEVDVAEDTFQLFVVPAANLRKANAMPIVCDGTKESYLIRGINPAALGSGQDMKGEDTRLHSVVGVYKLTPRGLAPLRSALLSAGEWAYEIEVRGGDGDHLEHRLLLQCPSALTKPETVSVAALWHQPKFDTVASGTLGVELQRLKIDGLKLELTRSLLPHRASPLQGDPRRLLHLLALRTEVFLGRDEIMSVMAVLGLDRTSRHAAVIDLVVAISGRKAPDSDPRGSGVKFLYEVELQRYPPEQQDLVDDFREQLHALLDAWLPGPVAVQVRLLSETKVQLSAGDPS